MNENVAIRSAVSLVGMKSVGELKTYIDEMGADARFELSYTMSAEFLEEVRPLVQGKVLSVHSCCPATDYFPNLASADPEVAKQSFADMEATHATAIDFGAKIVVLHAGYVTDLAMPSSYAARKEVLSRPEFLEGIRYADGAICGPGYCTSPRYIRHAQLAKERLVALARNYSGKGLRLAVENLNPRSGYLFHTPGEMVDLAALDSELWLCLDIGHLYIASFAYGFDFIEGVREIAGTGKVATCHLHANTSGPERFKDDHKSLDYGSFPFEQVLKILVSSKANLVVESVQDLARNTSIVQRALKGQGVVA